MNKAFAAGAIFSDEKLGERVASYEDVQGLRFGGSYTVGDVAMKDYDFREESGDRDQTELQAVDDVARINVTASRAFGNPRATKRMTESQRIHSMWYRFAETMSRMDGSTAKLLNELAFAGWQAGRDTADRLSAEKHQGKSDKAGFSDRFLVVAQTEGEARIVRAWMNLAMSHTSDGRTMGDERPTRFTADRLPPVEEVAELLRASRPGLDKDSVIGVVAAPGAEKAAIRFMGEQGQAVMPGAGRQFWAEIGKNTSLKIRQLDSKKRQSDERINESVAWEADRLVVFMTGNADADAVLMPAAARAFQRGTLAAAFDAKGKELSQFALGEEADKQFPSRRVEEHLSEISRFGYLAASSAEGRLFFSLMPKMSREAIDALANTDRSVGDVLHLARTEEGRATLFAEFKLSSESLNAMASGDAVTAAGAAHDRIKLDCSNHGVTIVGPESFPGALKHDAAAPAVLYVQAKNPHALGGVKPHVLMVGDDGVPAFMSARINGMAKLIDAEGCAIAQIEGAGQPGHLGKTDPVLWLSTGHGHADVKFDGLKWSNDALPTAMGANSTWTIQKKKLDKKDLFELVETSRDGAQKIVGKLYAERNDEKAAEAVRDLKSKASVAEADNAKQPAFAARKAVVETGGFVVSAQPPRDKNLAYRFQTKSVSGYPTVATKESRRETARLAAKAAEALCVTYTKGDITSSAAIGASIEAGKGMIAVSAPESQQFSLTVERHVALYTRPGRQIADLFHNLPAGGAKVKLTQDYADAQICGFTGKEMAGAASRVASRVNGETIVKAAKKEANRELA